MKPSLLVSALALGLVACGSSPNPPSPGPLAHLAGPWDEPGPDICKSPQVISFEGNTTMLLTYADVGWVTEDESRKVFRYRLLDVGPSVIRMQLEDEPRLDADGKPVVWHVVSIDRDTYCWSRDDWPQGACTAPRRRCPVQGSSTPTNGAFAATGSTAAPERESSVAASSPQRDLVEFSTSLDFDELALVLRQLETSDAEFAAELMREVAGFRASSNPGEARRRLLADGHGYVDLEREDPHALGIAVFTSPARAAALETAYDAASPEIEDDD